ncbi:hypothetical protein BH09PAT2_BH09PAT2_03480 [soil metagenome]
MRQAGATHTYFLANFVRQAGVAEILLSIPPKFAEMLQQSE